MSTNNDDSWAGRSDHDRRVKLQDVRDSQIASGHISELGKRPQHDKLVLFFRDLKLQDFQSLNLSLYKIWMQKNPQGAAQAKPAYTQAWVRAILAQEVLVNGELLLGAHSTGEEWAPVHQVIYDSIRQRFKMKNKPPSSLYAKIWETIARSMELLQTMSNANPPAHLLVPSKGTPFSSDQHEPIIGCPDGPAASVKLMVFPGYQVRSSNSVLEKALVYTK